MTTSFPRLQESSPVVDEQGKPTLSFHIWWDQFAAALETNLGALSEAETANANAIAALAAAAAAAADAAAAAHTADWSGIVDDDSHKPENDATLGANLATNVTGTIDDVSDGTTYAKIKKTYMTSGQPKLQIAGSGTTIGDQRNLPPIAAANLHYKFSGAISYTATAGTPATATISVGAGSLILGSTSVSYSAMSAAVTGTNGTTVTYYLYVSTNGYTAGAHTLHQTTNPDTIYSDDNNVYIGTVDVVFPSSGSGSGGGSGGGGACVSADSLVLLPNGKEIVARYLKLGDLVWTQHEHSRKWGAYPIVSLSFVERPIYTLKGHPDATADHRFGWFFGWYKMKWFGRPNGVTTVMQACVKDSHTYVSRKPGDKWRLCHNIKPI